MALPALRELTLQLGDEFCGVILLFMLEFPLFWRRLARRRRSTQGLFPGVSPAQQQSPMKALMDS
jgi:hypothetical protein